MGGWRIGEWPGGVLVCGGGLVSGRVGYWCMGGWRIGEWPGGVLVYGWVEDW